MIRLFENNLQMFIAKILLKYVACLYRMFIAKILLKSKFRILSKRPPREDAVLEKNFSRYKLIDTDGNEITVDQLLDKYFSNPELCFAKDYKEPEKNFIFTPPDMIDYTKYSS
jgi:hypothetical protein